MCFHGPLGDEEVLCDLTVCTSIGGEACDAKLARGQRIDSRKDGLARAPAGGKELLAGTGCEWDRGGAVGDLESLAKMVAGLDAVMCATKGRSELYERSREVESGRGLPEQLDRVS
jgi:hypothetical protein